ncbi:MAG: SBBP repeat-containing protein [Bacteroidetes bacterium]|nr:SBBP repeat-containing protein [Bacteroidota bacterium]
MFLSKLDPSGNFAWAHSGGAAASTFIKSMTTDPSGNIYTTGFFLGQIDFDPGSGIYNLSSDISDTGGDVFITKSNSSGSLIWAKQLGGISYDYATSIAVDAAGNVYTAGSFEGTADFDPGSGTFNLTASSSNADILFQN